MPHSCHDQNELENYLAGRLPADCYDTIDQHLAECEHCLETLTSLGDTVEPSLAELHAVLAADEWETEAACLETLRKIKFDSLAALSHSHDRAGNELPEAPEAIRDYEIIGVLGTGGMGVVYDAVHSKLHRNVALKVLASRRVNNADAVRRFEREMQLVGTLQNRHVVAAVDAGEADGIHYLVMERVNGVDLSNVLRRLGRLSVADACEIIRQAAEGLSYIHEHGMVHRDIKPSNLMLAVEQGEPIVKILDLGLARLQQHDGVAELTAADQLMGTLDFMAPEQTEASRSVDARADVYALGATLYKLLCGRAPFENGKYDSSVKKLRALDSEQPQPVREIRGDVPRKLSQLVDRMLAKSPAKRPPSAEEVAAKLTKFVRGSKLAEVLDRAHAAKPVDLEADTSKDSLQATRELVESPAPSKASEFRARSSPWMAIVGVSIALLLVAATVVLWIGSSQGMVRIEINDPNMVVTIGDESYTIANSGETIRVTPGETNLTVRRGDLEFETIRFTIGNGANPDLVVDYYDNEARIKFAGETMRLESNAPSVEPIEKVDAEAVAAAEQMRRDAVERLLQLNAKMTVRNSSGEFQITTMDELAGEPFEVADANLRGIDVITRQCCEDLVVFSELENLDMALRTVELDATEPLSRLVNLRHLKIRTSGLRDGQFSFLQGCVSLESVFFDGGIIDRDLAFLANAKQLNTVHISYADVTGVGFSSLPHLQNLKRVDLGRSKLNDKGAAEIARLPALEHFWAVDTDLTDKGIEPFQNHGSIRHFVLQGTRITDACFEHLEGLDLTEIYVTNTAITGTAARAYHEKHPQCKIVFGNNAARQIIPAQSSNAQASIANEMFVAQWILANDGEVNRRRDIVMDSAGNFALQRAFLHNMSDEKFATIAERLHKCENIHEFTIAGQHLTAKSLPAIARVDTDELKISDLSATAEEFSVLAELPHRTQVTLVHSPSGHEFIAAVADIAGLVFVGLQSCNIVDEQSLVPLTRSQSITSIYLGSPELTSSGVAVLSQIPNLQNLRLVSQRLDDTMWQHLLKIQRLSELIVNAEGALNQDRLRGNGIEKLAALRKLTRLSLQSCNLSDDAIQSMSKLTQLRHLEFHNVGIEDRHLSHLQELRNLEILILSNTKVTVSGADDFQTALPACKVMRSPE